MSCAWERLLNKLTHSLTHSLACSLAHPPARPPARPPAHPPSVLHQFFHSTCLNAQFEDILTSNIHNLNMIVKIFTHPKYILSIPDGRSGGKVEYYITRLQRVNGFPVFSTDVGKYPML